MKTLLTTVAGSASDPMIYGSLALAATPMPTNSESRTQNSLV